MRPAAILRGLILTIGVIACSAPLACGKAAQRAGIPVDETQRLRQENESLAKQYELAAGNAFYLLVDPSAGQLTLAFRGAALRRYSLLDAQVGVPRIAFIIWGVRRDPAGIIWSGGRLDPEPPFDRVELKVSSSGSGGEPPSPPLPPEVAAPVPATYVLRYEPGLVIEVERAGDSASAGWRHLLASWRTRGRNALAACSSSDRRLTHLRLVLASADADSLYRSLPPGTKLLIVAPGAKPSDPVTPSPGTRGSRRTS